jgi:hypothetical protein
VLALTVFARRLRGLYRLAWYRLTGRPRFRREPTMDDAGCRPVRGEEAGLFCRLALSWQRAGEMADEPVYDRRPR